MEELTNLNRLGSILQKSKAVMEQVKDVPRNRYAPETEGFESVANTSYGEMPEVITERISNNDNVFGFNEESMAKSKFPKEVLDAMKESQRERAKMGSSVTSGIDESLIAKVNNKKTVLKEQTKPQINNSNASNVDYSLIKMIVEDCMKKYTSSIKKTLLSESKGSSLELMTQQGNTFRFVTADGKIFEGKLTYKGNIKEK